jgi:hypothetical protein
MGQARLIWPERGGVGVLAADKLTAIAAEGADFDPS